ncbi:MAG: long-chain fatty acid--CoA ligase [Ignavibacteria bacterium]|nr:long-chain fatty acid--CoA ligase [Ignavibacteria bacterium]
MDATTIPQLFLQMTERYANDTTKFAFSRKINGVYTGITFDDVRSQVECFAVGLLELGIKPQDRVGIVSENRLEWIIADLAITSIGAINVAIFPTLTAKQQEYIFTDCEATCVIVSNSYQLNKFLKVSDDIPSIRQIIVMNHDAKGDHPLVKSMDDVMEVGRVTLPSTSRRQLFERYAARVEPGDTLTLVYTSGTTGNPRGVELTNSNIIANLEGCLGAFDVRDTDIFLSYLPLCHSFERIGGLYLPLAVGASVCFAESIDKVPENIREVRPTIMTSVPKLFEKIQNKILSKMDKESDSKKKIFHWAVGVGKKFLDATLDGKSPTLSVSVQYQIAKKLVFSKIQEPFGGRIRLFVSGGAALPKATAEFFLIVGFTILEGYGMTEASPVISVNRVGKIEIGTVGTQLDNVEVKIAEDGEILARGANVMKGYWNDPKATAEAIDSDKWLHTGDIGVITAKGNIQITDRKKHIIVTSSGKNIAPAPIESLISQSRYIERCFLIGNDREFCTALIIPEFEMIHTYAKSKGIEINEETLPTNQDIIAFVQNELNVLQKDLAKFEKVRRFTILPQPFTVDSGELTPKLSIKRSFVETKYAEVIESMYS